MAGYIYLVSKQSLPVDIIRNGFDLKCQWSYGLREEKNNVFLCTVWAAIHLFVKTKISQRRIIKYEMTTMSSWDRYMERCFVFFTSCMWRWREAWREGPGLSFLHPRVWHRVDMWSVLDMCWLIARKVQHMILLYWFPEITGPALCPFSLCQHEAPPQRAQHRSLATSYRYRGQGPGRRELWSHPLSLFVWMSQKDRTLAGLQVQQSGGRLFDWTPMTMHQVRSFVLFCLVFLIY